MKIYFVLLTTIVLLSACKKTPSQSESTETISNEDLHPHHGIIIIKSSDDIERGISFFPGEQRGDQYIPPELNCEASSIDRLLEVVSETEVSIDKNIEIEGLDYLPQGTYRYSFFNRSWKSPDDVFDDVVKATEEAFNLKISVTKSEGKRHLTITKMENKSQ